MEYEKEAKELISKAMLYLMFSENYKTTFFYSIALQLGVELNDDRDQLAFTTGKRIYLTPNIAKYKLEHKMVAALIVHEAIHVCLEHPVRADNLKNTKIAALAIDYVTNNMLDEMKFPRVIFRDEKGNQLTGIYDDQKRFINMSVEEIYKILEDELGADSSPQNPMCGTAPENDQGQGENQAMGTDTVNRLLVTADKMAKDKASNGDNYAGLGGTLGNRIKELITVKIDWRKELLSYMKKLKSSGYSYRKLNKAYLPNMIAPTRSKKENGELIILWDVSGSITDKTNAYILANLRNIIAQIKPKNIHLVQFSVGITSKEDVKNISDIEKLPIVSNYGTAIADCFPYMEERKRTKGAPSLIVCFTDMHIYDFPAQGPNTPIIFVSIDNERAKAPFGKILHLDTGEI